MLYLFVLISLRILLWCINISESSSCKRNQSTERTLYVNLIHPTPPPSLLWSTLMLTLKGRERRLCRWEFEPRYDPSDPSRVDGATVNGVKCVLSCDHSIHVKRLSRHRDWFRTQKKIQGFFLIQRNLGSLNIKPTSTKVTYWICAVSYYILE